MLFGLLVFAAIVLAVFSLAATYNKLVAASGRAARAWQDLDALLHQRHDEIPKLIELCEPHLHAERATFERALETRSALLAARQTRDAAALEQAEAALRAEVEKLLAMAAAHPTLGGSPAFGLLRQRNATLDAEVAERRTVYNESVRIYNAAIARLPGSIVALLGGFRALRPLAGEAETGR
jgi:LemA protein